MRPTSPPRVQKPGTGVTRGGGFCSVGAVGLAYPESEKSGHLSSIPSGSTNWFCLCSFRDLLNAGNSQKSSSRSGWRSHRAPTRLKIPATLMDQLLSTRATVARILRQNDKWSIAKMLLKIRMFTKKFKEAHKSNNPMLKSGPEFFSQCYQTFWSSNKFFLIKWQLIS